MGLEDSTYHIGHTHSTDSRGVSIHPDENIFAVAGWGNGVFVVDMSTGSVNENFLTASSIHEVDFSPNGSWLAHADGSGEWETGATSTSTWNQVFDTPGICRDVSFSSDSKYLAVASNEGASGRNVAHTYYDASDGYSWVSSSGTGSATGCAFSTDASASTYYGRWDSGLTATYSTDGGSLSVTSSGNHEDSTLTAEVDVDRNNNWAAFGSDDGVEVFPAGDVSSVSQRLGGGSRVRAVSFSPDSDEMVIPTPGAAEVREVGTWNLTGTITYQNLDEVYGSYISEHYIAFAGLLSNGDGSVEIYERPSGAINTAVSAIPTSLSLSTLGVTTTTTKAPTASPPVATSSVTANAVTVPTEVQTFIQASPPDIGIDTSPASVATSNTATVAPTPASVGVSAGGVAVGGDQSPAVTASPPNVAVSANVVSVVSQKATTVQTGATSLTVDAYTALPTTEGQTRVPTPTAAVDVAASNVLVTADQFASITAPSTASSVAASGVTVESRTPVTVAVDSTPLTLDVAGVSASGVQSPSVSAEAAGAAVSAPNPVVASREPTSVSVSATSLAVTTGGVEWYLSKTVGVDDAFTFVQAPNPGVRIYKDTYQNAPATSLNVTTDTVTVTNNKAVYVTPEPATLTASSPWAAANPIHTAVPVSGVSKTVTAGNVAVEERHPTTVTVHEAETTVTATELNHLEAIAPIASNASAIQGRGTIAQSTATIGQNIDIDSAPSDWKLPDNHHQRQTVGRDHPEFGEPTSRRVLTEDDSVFTPDRRLYINGYQLNVDRDLFVSAGEYGFSIADCTLYNLDTETWAWIDQQDELRVELGWEQGERQTVFDGDLVIKRRRSKFGNRAYVLRARERGARVLTTRFNRTFNGMSPHRIVEHLAVDIDGIERGYIAGGSERIGGAYTISRSKELNDWLDRLARKASKQTGERWVWYIDRGELSFHPAKEQVTDRVPLSMDKSVIRATPAGRVGDDSSLQKQELLMHCEPILRRGLSVTVDGSNAINPRALYRISEFTHDSSTTSGRHHTTAIVEPMRKEVEYPL